MFKEGMDNTRGKYKRIKAQMDKSWRKLKRIAMVVFENLFA